MTTTEPHNPSTGGLRPLCLAFWMPPLVRPQAILLGKMIPEWLRQGMAPLLAGHGDAHRNQADGQSMDQAWTPGAPVVSLPFYAPPRGAGRLPRLAAWLEDRHLGALERLLRPHIKAHQANLVFAFANPQRANLLGALLARRTGLPLVAHFSDPYATNPYKEFSPAERRQALRRERSILEAASRVVFVSEALRDMVLAEHPQRLHAKARVVPHCYDPRLYPEAEPREGGPFVIRHVGGFYVQRNPEGLLRSLAMALDRAPHLRDKVRLELVGDGCDARYTKEHVRKAVAESGLEGITAISSNVPYEQSLALMRSADCLVTIDADFQDSPFLPSKVIDYVGSGSRIVAVTPEDSPTWRLAGELGFPAVPPGREDALADLWLTMLQDPAGRPAPTGEAAARYGVERTTGLLREIFQQALSEQER